MQQLVGSKRATKAWNPMNKETADATAIPNRILTNTVEQSIMFVTSTLIWGVITKLTTSYLPQTITSTNQTSEFVLVLFSFFDRAKFNSCGCIILARRNEVSSTNNNLQGDVPNRAEHEGHPGASFDLDRRQGTLPVWVMSVSQRGQ